MPSLSRAAPLLAVATRLLAAVASVAIAPAAGFAQEKPQPAAAAADTQPMTMETFLDRVMMAESGGRADLRSKTSTALGAYQLIEGTFLGIVRRHFAAETASLAPVQLLALRLNPVFSRRVAEAFTRENATHLASHQLEPTFQSLRLAYLVGPGGAVRVLKANPDTPLSQLLSPAAIIANPFMAGMTARGLIARTAREIALSPANRAGVAAAPGSPGAQARAPGIAVRCNLALPSCRKWVALRQGRVATAGARIARR